MQHSYVSYLYGKVNAPTSPKMVCGRAWRNSELQKAWMCRLRHTMGTMLYLYPTYISTYFFLVLRTNKLGKESHQLKETEILFFAATKTKTSPERKRSCFKEKNKRKLLAQELDFYLFMMLYIAFDSTFLNRVYLPNSFYSPQSPSWIDHKQKNGMNTACILKKGLF